MVYCCVPNCVSNLKTRRKRPSLYSFPTNPEKRNVWIKTLSSFDADVTTESQVCYKHFPDYMYRETKNKKYLCGDAYPALFVHRGKITEVKLDRSDLDILRKGSASKGSMDNCISFSENDEPESVEENMEAMFKDSVTDIKREIKEEKFSELALTSDEGIFPEVTEVIDMIKNTSETNNEVQGDDSLNEMEWQLVGEEYDSAQEGNQLEYVADPTDQGNESKNSNADYTEDEQEITFNETNGDIIELQIDDVKFPNERFDKMIRGFSHMCRICMEICEEDMVEITDELAAEFAMFINIPLIGNDERLPRNLCSECGLAVRNIILLLSQCSSSLSTLTQVLAQFDQTLPKPPVRPRGRPSQKFNEDVEFAMSMEQNSDKPILRARSSLQCPVCHEDFVGTKAALGRHISGHSPFVCEECGLTSVSWNEMQTHKSKLHPTLVPEDSRLLCYVCGQVFAQNSSYKSHMFRHINSNNFPCDVCGKAFSSLAALKLHLRIHNNIRPYKCNHCTMTFRQQSHLKRHELVKHSNEDPVSCDLCGKEFSIRLYLHEHLYRIHKLGQPPPSSSRAKQATCNHCGKGLSSRHVLADHLNTRHAPDSLTPDEIELVERYSRRVIERAEQMKYDCQVCGRGLRDEISFTAHMRKHTGEVPFRCEDCNMIFSNEPNWRRHMKTHSKLRTQSLFPCPLCGINFYTRSHRHKHMKICEKKLIGTDEKYEFDEYISNEEEDESDYSEENEKFQVAACEEIVHTEEVVVADV